MNETKNTQLVLVYIRYSSHAQDNGNSPAAQMTCAENYVKAHQMCIEKIYTDYAKTGRNINRDGYQQMKEDLLSERVRAKVIIVRALDRLHRNAGNQINDLKWLEEHGIRLIAVNDGIDTASSDYSKFATVVKAAAAEETSDNISRNTRAALLESAKQCRHLGGVPPIGYTVNDAGLYEIDARTAPIVRDIYTLYNSGMGYSYIKKHLKQKGYKTTGGNNFSDTAIHTILTNKKYKGTYTYDRTAAKDSDGHRNSHKIKPDPIEIPDGMPAIIEPELFDKVQEKMAQNSSRTASRTGKNYYALNGLTYCATCGKPFSGNVNHSNGHKYLQYRKSCDCVVKSVRADQLAPFVFHAVKNCIFCPDNKQKIIDRVNQKLSRQKMIQSGETNTIQNQINGLEKANANLMVYLEKGRATETILRSIDKNETEIQQLKQQLEAVGNTISEIDETAYQELVQKFTNYMCTEKSPEAAALKSAVIQEIQIGKETITVAFQPGVSIDKETKAYFNIA
ncbi:recombinase family protein [Ruminococcus sp.]|uniref:recombinase family protein n=1 Tax=Ruminococcus sp. TaxID=41978 RepID=UPI0025D8BF54|nr:recombinase family protein [Ruminococcus sp.]